MTQNDLESIKELLPTADVVYVYFAELHGELLKRIRPSQIICVFAESLQDTEQSWLYVRERLSALATLPNFKILTSPTDPNYEEIAKEVGAEWFPKWTVPIFVFRFTPQNPKETFFMFYGRSDTEKGEEIVESLIGKVPIVSIGTCRFSRGFVYTNEALWLQSRSFALLHPSKSDSVSRTLASAMLLEQIPILLRTIAAYFRTWTFGWRNSEFLHTVPIANSIDEFISIAESAFRDPASFRERFVDKIRAFMGKYKEYWDPHILWERWRDKFGFTLPADLMPLHNIFWIGSANLAEFPDGPWKLVEPSLNIRLR